MSERSEAQERSARNKSANSEGPIAPGDALVAAGWVLDFGYYMLYRSLSAAHGASIHFVRSKNKRVARFCETGPLAFDPRF